jgi:hypothetical protein
VGSKPTHPPKQNGAYPQRSLKGGSSQLLPFINSCGSLRVLMSRAF